MSIHDYVIAVRNRYKTGIATEHSYRADLQALVGTARVMGEIEPIYSTAWRKR